MLSHVLGALATGAAIVLLSGAAPSAQEQFTNNFKYNTGQSVQPIFEGWSWAPDGSINLHFGYLNRNYVQEPTVPVGANNSIQPGGPDRGQPTFFYSRTQRNLFTVNVPKDWDRKREVIWTVTVNGKAEKAVGWLQAEWEIDPVGGAGAGGGDTDPERKMNQAPAITVDPLAPVTLPGVATLMATITDDGLPKPRPRSKPAVGQETPPTLQGGVDAPVNVPAVATATRETPPGASPGAAGARPLGLSVSWIVWRGPAAAAFSPQLVEPKDTKAVTTATFSAPGEYVLRARVTDTFKTVTLDTRVTVRQAAPNP
ncbi:MAG: hypothetical protein CK533_11900 [Acidobacterium sp.]|nr:MAG: hypothetical protein CK533_11900 [Acidobacterium sp.]